MSLLHDWPKIIIQYKIMILLIIFDCTNDNEFICIDFLQFLFTMKSTQEADIKNLTINSQSKLNSTMKSKINNPIEIIPQYVEFLNIQTNLKYYMQLNIMNQGKQNEKIRIICPTTPYFSLKVQSNPFIIAPGLNYKIIIYFHLQGTADCADDIFQDRILVIGQSFKKQIVLKATKPNFILQAPKFFNIGLIRVGKQTKFSIPIKNVGKQDVQIAMLKTSSPTITIEEHKLIIKKQSEGKLKIKVNGLKAGAIQQSIYLPNRQPICIKGICCQQNIEIYDKQGSSMNSLNLGQIFIGQRLTYPFFIANNSSTKIEGLTKVFSSNVVEYNNFKVDLSKMTFVNRTNPKDIIEQQRNIYFRCSLSKFTVNPFQDFQNKVIMVRAPTEQQMELFSKQAISNAAENNNRQSSATYKSVTQINQILYIKVINKEQPIKIPISFCPIIPKIKISNDKFEFPTTKPKQISKLKLRIKNLNQKRVSIKLQGAYQFYLQGETEIEAHRQRQLQLCFRPLIGGQYSQHFKLVLFNSWIINIKAFGICQSPKIEINKQNFSKVLNKSASLDAMKSARFLQQERRRRKQVENTVYLKNKITQRTQCGFMKDPDLPIDLIFDACQNPKVKSHKKFGIKTMCSTLFFNKDEYAKNLAQKRKSLPSTTARLNLKQIIKFSEQLSPVQLSKIQVRCDKLDFGNVFVGSLNQRQLIISNKNNKVILVQIDLCNNQSLAQTKAQIKKVQPYCEAKFVVKLKPAHLGYQKIPIYYVINKQHIFQMDITANVTLINLGFSTKHLKFQFAPNDLNFQKVQTLTVTNYGSTTTKFIIVEPINKAFSVVSNKQQQISPNSLSHIQVKYSPLDSGQSGQSKTDNDKMIVKVIGGAENHIKCEGSAFQPKYSIKQTQINLSQIFISVPNQNKLTIRNHTKQETPIKIQLNPPSLSQILDLDQRNFILHSEQRKQLTFTVLSHEIKIVRGLLIISARGGKTYKLPIYINFCFPTVEVVGCDNINLGIVHIMTDHFERQITLLNKTNSEIKLQAGKDEKDDYIIQFIAAQDKVQLAYRNTQKDSELSDTDRKFLVKKQSIYVEQSITTAKHIKNPKKLSTLITLLPGIETTFKMKFIPKLVKQYSIKIPLYLHKATRQIQAISQKIVCKAMEPLFFVNPYSLSFDNVVITENEHAHKKEFQIINPHDKQVDWQIKQSHEPLSLLFLFEQTHGKLKPKQKKKITIYFKPVTEGLISHRIKLFSNQAKEIQVELQINGSAVSPKISFNKNLLILPVVPLRTESKSILQIQNYGYETVSINKVKFSHQFEGVDLTYQFLDGKLLSLAKKKLKMQISFKSQIPVSVTTCLQVLDEFGDKISIPISLTADNCVLTTYPYLQMNGSMVVYDNTQNMYKLLVSKAFSCKNKQTNISGSSAVTGNFIKKWCNYQLNINLQSFPDSLVESKGELLYEMIIKMANGRCIVKRPSFSSEDKLARMLQLHAYYAQVINALQGQGAFLNHIRPQYLLNMNDYLLYMVHNGFIIQQDQFQCLSHESWTVLFYQLCKLYIQSAVNEKLLQKFNIKPKNQKIHCSTIYSQKEILILAFMNQFLGQQKIASLSDQARIFQAIQKILQKTFKINLNEELSKLKINADSLMLYEFLITVSKFLFTYLQQYGLSMYLQPNDLFTMSHKQFILFFVSLIQNLVNFQTFSLVQFESAFGQKNQKVIELQNPSKKKVLKYWVKIYGSTNFKSNQKELQIEPQQKKMLKIIYSCKKHENQQAQLILVPVKDQMYFTNAQSLNFMLRNLLKAKSIMKKINIKVHLYDIKTVNLDVQLPIKQQSGEYEVKMISNQFMDQTEYPNYYLLQPGKRVIKNGKDKCEIKIAPLQFWQISFRIIYVSTTLQQYIYEISASVILPSISQTLKLEPLTVDKQQSRFIKIPIQNEQKQACLKFHREMNKEKEKKKISQPKFIISLPSTKNKVSPKIPYRIQFIQQFVFTLKQNTVKLGPKQKNQTNANSLQILANFTKPYRQYKSSMIVKNEQLGDYRVYSLVTSVSIRPKIFNMKITTKARQTIKTVIPNKMNPFTFRAQRNVPNFQIIQQQNGDLVTLFSPIWSTKDQLQLYIESPQTFEQHIYKIKLQAMTADPIKQMSFQSSSLFTSSFEFDLSTLNLTQKQLNSCRLRSQIQRKHEVRIEAQKQIKRIVGTIYPGEQQQNASIKLYLPKSDKYYQFLITIKNIPVTNLGNIEIQQKIGQIKKTPLKQIQSTTKDFYFQCDEANYFQYQVSDPKPQSYFVIVFKPIKQLNDQRIFKFKSNRKQYLLNVNFKAKKLDTVFVPVIITQNMQKKFTTLQITNLTQKKGIYNIYIQDQQRFKLDTYSFEIKSKQKISLKLAYSPKFINDTAKSKIILKSQILPQLTYIAQGISKFKFQQIYEQVEGFEGSQAQKQIIFKNQFNQREKFKFQISPENSTYSFQNDEKMTIQELQPGQQSRIIIKNKCLNLNNNEQNLTKVTISKVSLKKVMRQITLKLSIIKNLKDKNYKWECRARQTIFETIKLPYGYSLKQIKTDADLQKYITFNIDQKNQNEVRVKFAPLKRIKDKIYNILLVTDKIKFRIQCFVKVTSPPLDDTILIRTSEVKQTGVAVFKLTNTIKQPATFKAFFQKNIRELTLQTTYGVLEPYGKDGTPITLTFKSDVNNKKVEDRLVVETQNMEWIFKVIGMQEKLLSY